MMRSAEKDPNANYKSEEDVLDPPCKKLASDEKGFSITLRYICAIILVIPAAILCHYCITAQSERSDVFKSSFEKNRNSKPKVSNGGWKTANQNTLSLYGTKICDIDKRLAEDLSIEEFEREYKHKNPVIIYFKNGAKDWTVPKQWTLKHLKHHYADWSVMVADSRDIVRNGGRGDVAVSISEFIRNDMQTANASVEPMYVFDRDFYQDSHLPETIRIPIYFQNIGTEEHSFFFLGSSGSGVSFHNHAESWNGVIYGRKRWFLYPPTVAPPGGVYPAFTQLEWFRDIYPNLSEANRPVECIQEAGEIIYMPERMYHATLNIGDTVAVSMHLKQASTEIGRLFTECMHINRQQRSEEGDRRLVDIFMELHRLLPDNAEVHMRLGEAYMHTAQLSLALKFTQNAIQLDPYFMLAYLSLAKIYIQLGNAQEADKTYKMLLTLSPTLWDIYAQYGDFLMSRSRPLEAVHMYKKGTEIKPNVPMFWYGLKSAQDQLGDKEGAEESQRHIDRLSR